MWYLPCCPGRPAIGGWCARYRIHVRNEVDATIWIELSTTDIRTRSPRQSIWNSDLAWPTLSSAALQYPSNACLTISSSNVEDVPISFSSRTFSETILPLLALMTSVLLCLFVASFPSRSR